MDNNKWRFPAANYGLKNGITTGDSEAFKKNPYSAFAREILQNSIDAQASTEEPVKVVFSEFNMLTKDIPGIDDLKIAIRRCKEFWAYKKDYVDEYEKIEKVLDENELACLRISDFNTTGLVGVESNEKEKNHFIALTKGSGVSEKNGAVAGGSKGMGKNAAFLMSKIKTVFYSTRTTMNIDETPGTNIGSIGVADFCSGYVADDESNPNRDYTQGKGFYSSDDFNSALQKTLDLDSKYTIRNSTNGTDIYILGFRGNDNWKKEVINSILDSFMAAIFRGQLEIEFNDLEINKETIGSIVYSDRVTLSNKSNIISQYRLLTGDNVKTYPIETDYGSCELYILPYDKDEEALATHKCVMIRHPLMKIKDESLGASFRVSAMCIIGDDNLGKMLRKIENPQHIDWEPKRIVDDPSLKKELDGVLKSIKNQIMEKVIECLQLGDANPLDPNGAGDFLPDEDIGESHSESDDTSGYSESTIVTTPKEVIINNRNANQDDVDGQGLQPDVGDKDDDKPGEVVYPTGNNNGQGEDPHGGSGTGQRETGDSIIMVRSKLSGVKYNVISTGKECGKIKVIFKAPITFSECYLNIGMLDDSNNQEKVNIIAMKCNGIDIKCDNLYEFGPFSISQNEKVVLDVITNIKGYFGATIKVVCIERKEK